MATTRPTTLGSLKEIGLIAKEIQDSKLLSDLDNKGDIEFLALSYKIVLIAEILTPGKLERPAIDNLSDYKENISTIMSEYKFVPRSVTGFTQAHTDFKTIRNLFVDKMSNNISENKLRETIKIVATDCMKFLNFSIDTPGDRKEEQNMNATGLRSAVEEEKSEARSRQTLSNVERLSIMSASIMRIKELKIKYAQTIELADKDTLFCAISMLYVVVGEHARFLSDNTMNQSIKTELALMFGIRGTIAHFNMFYQKTAYETAQKKVVIAMPDTQFISNITKIASLLGVTITPRKIMSTIEDRIIAAKRKEEEEEEKKKEKRAQALKEKERENKLQQQIQSHPLLNKIKRDILNENFGKRKIEEKERDFMEIWEKLPNDLKDEKTIISLQGYVNRALGDIVKDSPRNTLLENLKKELFRNKQPKRKRECNEGSDPKDIDKEDKDDESDHDKDKEKTVLPANVWVG